MPNITSVIKSIQDIMRKDTGVDGDAQRLSQLVWMLFLKIYADKEAEYEIMEDNYKSPMPEKYRWQTWAGNDEGMTGDELINFIANDLFPTLQDLPIEGDDRALIIRDIFQDSYNYMKSGTLIRQVINKINEIDFNSSDDRHTFNDIYEQLLKSLQSAGNSGEYYTPRAVTQFVVDMIDPQLGEKVLDPACGTGGFLSCTIEHLRKQVKSPDDEITLQQNIYGVEKKPLPHQLCTTNMILHGIDTPKNIRRDNTLEKPLQDITPEKRVDCVVTNPPFGGIEEDGIESNFPAPFRTRETADLFLVFIMKILKTQGRAGIVLPDGSLYGDSVKTRIRKKLLEEFNLHTIIRLPNTVFAPYAKVGTNLLFFEKGSQTKEIWYYEHKLPEKLKNYSKTNPIKNQEFDPIRDWWNNRVENDCAWKVSIDEIKSQNFDLNFKNPKIKKTFVLTKPSAIINDFIDINLKAEYLMKNLPSNISCNNTQEASIGELCNIVKGTTPIKKVIPGDYPLVVTGEYRLSSNEYQFDGNAVCIPLVSSTGHGHASIKRLHYQEGKFALGNILTAIIPNDENILNAEFLYIYLSYFKDDLLVSLMKGSANVSLTINAIKTVKIKFPNIDKQREIVETIKKLKDIELKIEEAKQHSSQLMQSILQEAFNCTTKNDDVVAIKNNNQNIVNITSIIEKRAALSAEIVSQLHDQKRFGSVKNEKILYLCEIHLNLNLGGNYCKMPAGPHDYKSRYAVEEIFEEQKWISVLKDTSEGHEKTSYLPAENFEKHKEIFNSCFKEKAKEIQSMINLFKAKSTEKCEMVATLYATWNDLLIDGQPIGDELIIKNFKENWSKSKERFYNSDLMDELTWMRLKHLVPVGNGGKTIEFVNE